MLVISIGLLDTLVRDVKYGLRGLMRNPLLVLITTMSLGLGIGLNILVYSLVRSTLLESPTAADPGGLLNARVEFGSANISFPNYRLLTEATQFSGLAAYTDSVLDVNWQDRDEERTVISQVVSANFFDVLGVRAARGRTFTASEAQVELSPRLAVLGHSFWRGKLKGDQDVLGHLMVLNGEPFVIIGVLPSDYRSIKGFGVTPDIYLPISAAVLPDFNDRGVTRLRMVGRLASNATPQAARDSLLALARDLERQYPEKNGRLGRVTVFPISGIERLKGQPELMPVMGFFAVLFGTVCVVLIIACANVAGVLLARAVGRQREMAIRVALGAAKGRLLRQLVTESLILSLAGAIVGLLMNQLAGRLLTQWHLPIPFPIEFHFATDKYLFLAALVLAVVVTLMSGLAPALLAAKVNLIPALKENERGSTSGSRRYGIRKLLVVGQVSFSVLLLLGALSFLRNLLLIGHTDPGFDVDHIITVDLHRSGPARAPADGRLFIDRMIHTATDLPAVESASCAGFLPVSLFYWDPTIRLAEGSQWFNPNAQAIGPQYFSTMRIPLVRGREFQSSDDPDNSGAAIINQTFAAVYFPNKDAVGQSLLMSVGKQKKTLTIVGIVRNSHYRTLGESPTPVLYLPEPGTKSTMKLVVRTRSSPDAVIASLRTALEKADSSMAVKTETMRSHLEIALWPSKIGAMLIGSMGLLALVLAMVGLFGVVASEVTARTREFGIRIAMGAPSLNIMRLVFRDTGVLVSVGSAIGAVLAVLVIRPLGFFLAEGLSATDPLNFAVVIFSVTLVGLVASWVPATRAMRVDPIRAIWCE